MIARRGLHPQRQVGKKVQPPRLDPDAAVDALEHMLAHDGLDRHAHTGAQMGGAYAERDRA